MAKMSSLRHWCMASVCLLAAIVVRNAGVVRGEAHACGGLQEGCVTPAGSSFPTITEHEAMEEIQCTLGCIEENNIDLEVIRDYPTWPSIRLSQLEEDCGLYQKVQECQTGCLAHSRDPTLTTNKCRDSCYSQCRDSVCKGQTSCDQSGTTCERKCRKTFCRFGCALYSTLTGSERDASILSSPIESPVLTPLESFTRGLFHVNISSTMPQSSLGQQPQPTVGYLFKVEVANTDRVGFLLKTDLDSPLDLSGFACQQVSVSFRVISIRNISEYSPAAEICIGGVSGFPGQVDASSIAVYYSEDSRPDFLGYAVANITWERPPGQKYLSSYEITLTSQMQECGGTDIQYVFSGVSRDATSLMVMEDSPNGLMKFGCSYILTVLAQPAQQGESGTHESIAPSLSAHRTPELDLKCSKLWDPQGYFKIMATWTIANSSLLVEAIKRFTLYPTLNDRTKWGLFAVVERFQSQTIRPEEGVVQYSVLLTNFLPQRDPNLRYTIELRTDRKEEFFWRRIPQTKSCTVDSSSLPPLPLTNITVNITELTNEGARKEVELRLHWQPPQDSYGELSHYEVRIGPEATDRGISIEQTTSTYYLESFPATVSSAVISTSINLTEDSHCLYLQMRAHNEFLPSNWSEPVALALDNECNNQTANVSEPERNSSDSRGRIKIFFDNGNGSVQVLEVECSSNGGGTIDVNSGKVSTRLQQIEEKMEVVEELQSSFQTQLSSVDERIASLEEKLSALETFLSSRFDS